MVSPTLDFPGLQLLGSDWLQLCLLHGRDNWDKTWKVRHHWERGGENQALGDRSRGLSWSGRDRASQSALPPVDPVDHYHRAMPGSPVTTRLHEEFRTGMHYT